MDLLRFEVKGMVFCKTTLDVVKIAVSYAKLLRTLKRFFLVYQPGTS